MRPVFLQLFANSTPGGIDDQFKPPWDHLNKSVHASEDLRNRLVDESVLLAREHFDEAWARETLDLTTQIFDLIWLVVVKRFPDCIGRLDDDHTFAASPGMRAILQLCNS